MNIKRIVEEYWEYFPAHRFDNLDEMDQLLEKDFAENLLKFTQEETMYIGLDLLK